MEKESEIIDIEFKVLKLISGINTVMIEDMVSDITRSQICKIGSLAEGKIDDVKATTDFLLEIFDQLKFGETITLEQLQLTGGLVLKAKQEIEKKNETK